MAHEPTANQQAAPAERGGRRPAAAGPLPEPPRPYLVLVVMCAGMFLILLDATVVNVAVPSITAGLRTGTAGVQWVVDAYTVALASLLLAGGTAGDRIGHRAAVLAGLLTFGAASAGCALAASAGTLIAARAGQGVGAALLLPALLLVGTGIGLFVTPVVAMAVRAVPPDRSGLASGINNMARQVGTALGVAVFGAVAGSPARVPHFMSAMHALGVTAALAWLAAIAMILAIRRRVTLD